MCVEMLRGIAFDAKRIVNFKKEEYNWVGELKIQQYADTIIRNEKKKNPGAMVVVTGSSYYINHRISLFSHTGIMNEAEKINDLTLLNTKHPVILLVVLYEKHVSGYQQFLSQSKELEAGQFKGYSFYTAYVSPH
jgi:hypothetical protein